MIKITIITVVYNCVDTFEQTVSSVAEQSYPNIEYIVVDGGSTDGTLDVIKKYDNVITKWVSEPDDGIYDAMRKGVSMASGDYVQIIGADDCLCDKDVIAKVVENIDDETDVLSCCEYIVDGDRKLQRIYSNKHARNKENYIGGMIPHGGIFARLDLLKKYPFDKSYKIAADYKFFLECYHDENVNFKFIDMPVVFFEIHGTTGQNPEVCAHENKRIYEELGLYYNDNNQLSASREWVKKILKKLGLFQYVKQFLDKNVLWKPHKCNNRICRWCNRNI